MPTTINFEGVPDGAFNAHEESGYRFSTASNAADAFWGGLSVADLGTGDYIFIHNTTDTATVESIAGSSFGVSSVLLDGFVWTGFTPGGDPIPGSTAVQINFIGYKSDGTTVTWSFQTDALSGFENVVLPSAFSGGLLAFQWYAEGGSGLALFDNLVLQENRAPTAADFSGSGQADTTFIGHLTGSDPDGQTITYQPVGGLPEGVTLDPDGTLYVEPLPSDLDLSVGETRVITFQYQVTDGEAASAEQTITFTIQGVAALGQNICGNNKSNDLQGDAGADTICGKNGNDTISGLRGADKLYGDNGKDDLSGGDGDDFLSGGNGKDTLDGGAGDDELSGGEGNDLFVFGEGFGADVIFDYRSGEWECDDDDDDRDHDDDDDRRNGDHDDDDDDDDHGWGWDNDDHDHEHNSQCEWEGRDVIQLSPAVVGSFDELIQHGEQMWYGVVFTFDSGDTLTLMGVKLSRLDADDFLFA